MSMSGPPGPSQPENPYGQPNSPGGGYPPRPEQPQWGQPQRPGPPAHQQGGYPPPPGQPQWGQPQQSGPPGPGPFPPGAPPTPPKSGGKTGLIIAGVVAVLVLLGGGVAVWALMQSSNDSGGQTTGQAPGGNNGGAPNGGDEGGRPEDPVRAYWQATLRGDCDGAFDASTEKFWSQGGAQTKAEALANCKSNGAPQGARLGDVTAAGPATGNTATVNAEVTIEGQTKTVAHKVVKEDGEWKVDSLDIQ
jgi:hypothetical protein